jgi:hypothetical protein
MNTARLRQVQALERLYISNREAQIYLDMSEDQLRHLRDDGHLKFCKIGRQILYRVSDIIRMVEKHRVI